MAARYGGGGGGGGAGGGGDGGRDLYRRLGLAPGASVAEIKSAYRSKAVQLHPDKGGDPAAFAAVQEAYSVLSNSQRRRHYDETGRLELSPEEKLLQSMRRPQQQDAREGARSPSPAVADWRSSASPPQFRPGPRRRRADVAGEADEDEVGDEAGGASRGSSDGKREAAPSPRAASSTAPSTWLPPALRAALEGRELERVPVPPELLEAQVPQVTVSERDGALGLMLQTAPALIEDGHLREGEVLVSMQAVPLCLHELAATSEWQPGDSFGVQGVGKVVFLGPKVSGLSVGDWVLPLREVDEDGDLREGVAPPGTARGLAVYSASRCARLGLLGDEALSLGQLALAKSIGAAYHMVEEHVHGLSDGDTIIVNAANGVVGRVLVRLFATLGYCVLAVVRPHRGVELTRRKLEEGLGARKALLDDEDLRARVEELQVASPQLALDGVGGEATVRIASCLSKSGDLVCYGRASGVRRQVLPSGWGKKWKGTVHQYSIDEWLQQDLQGHSDKLSAMLLEASLLVQAGQMQLSVEEYWATGGTAPSDFEAALTDARESGRMHSVVLRFQLEAKTPSMPQSTFASAVDGKVPPNPFAAMAAAANAGGGALGKGAGRPLRQSWDLDFLEWEAEGEEERLDRRREEEGNLFKPGPMDEQRIQRYVDDSLAAPVALELGARAGEAAAVVLWLPGPAEVPEEHMPWLSRLVAEHEGLRAVVLRPRAGRRWYDMSDHAAVKLGLRYCVSEDIDSSSGCDAAGAILSSSSGSRGPGVDLSFPPLSSEELGALQQVEGAALALHRRCLLELRQSLAPRRRRALDPCAPLFLGGSGQGGSVALYAALCLMEQHPPRGVAFCHSGVPVAGMLGKRLTERVRQLTKLYAVYDRSDREVPMAFPEALHKMFRLLGCDSSLEWLEEGQGHEFCDETAKKVALCAAESLGPEFRRQAEAKASELLRERGVDFNAFVKQRLLEQRRAEGEGGGGGGFGFDDDAGGGGVGQQPAMAFRPLWESSQE